MAATLSRTSAVLTTFTSTLGCGIIFMPSAFNVLGYVKSIFILGLLSTLMGFTIFCIGYAARYQGKNSDITYPGIAGEFSNVMKVCVTFALFGSNLGTIVYISRKFVESGTSLFSKSSFLNAHEFYVKYTLIFFLAILCASVFYFGNVKILSTLSNVSVTIVILYTFITIFYGFSSRSKSFSELNKPSSDFGFGISRMIFALHCQFSFPSLYSEMIDKSESSLLTVSIYSSLLTFVVYCGSGLFGYKFLGSDINKDDMITALLNVASLGGKDGSYQFIGYPIDVVISKALSFLFLFVFFGAIVFSALPLISIMTTATESSSTKSRKMISGLLIVAMIVLSNIFVFDISTLLTIFSAICTNSLSYIFPSLFMIFSGKVASKLGIISSLVAFSSLIVGVWILVTSLKPDAA